MNKMIKAIVPLAALALIGYGCWLTYPPAAFITVGALLWLDFIKFTWPLKSVRKE